MQSESGSRPQSNGANVAAAHAWLSQQGDATLSEQIELASTPAPPFEEAARAGLISAKLQSLGLDPQRDEIGNVLASFPPGAASTDNAPVVVAAHIDTVFGPETAITIRREGDRCVGPGCTDNARGIAVALAVLRALIHGGARPRQPLVFAFTVGEEGPGDLRGVWHLFRPESSLVRPAAFIAVDGSGLRRITHRALGSRRLRITLRGPGGHSWTDWGRVNPANALGEFVHDVVRLALPESPRTTLTVARLGGGHSINAVPTECWVELDVRSEAQELLERVDSEIKAALRSCLAAEAGRGEGELSFELEVIGQRPAGHLPTSHPLVQAAERATRALGEEPKYTVSSTDANVPMALGVPAIAIGGGGRSGETHTENEWFENSDGAAGPLRLLSLLASVARF